MAEFSTTQEYDDPCLPCKEDNLFYLDAPEAIQKKLSFRAFVNGKPTEIFPTKQIYRFPNKVEETRNALEFAANGMSKKVYFEDLQSGEPLVSEDLKAFIGIGEQVKDESAEIDETREMLRKLIEHPNTPETMRGQYRIRLNQLDEEDLQKSIRLYSKAGGDGECAYVLALDNARNFPDGDVNIDSLPPEQVHPLAADMEKAFWNKAKQVYGSLGGELVKEAISQGANFEKTFQKASKAMGKNWAFTEGLQMRLVFLREIFATGVGKVVRHRGVTLITFKGAAGNRVFLSRTAYPQNSMAVLDANVIKGNISGAVKSAPASTFKGTGGVFLVIGGIIEVAAWLETEPSQRFLSDLFVNLGIMIATGVLSSIAATAGVMGLVAVSPVAVPVIVTGVLIGVAAIGIGMIASWALEATGIAEDLRLAARRFFERAEVFFEPQCNPLQNYQSAIDKWGNMSLPRKEFSETDKLEIEKYLETVGAGL